MNLDNLVEKILSPLELKIKTKRDKNYLTQMGLSTITWPISAPIEIIHDLIRKDDGYPNPAADAKYSAIVGAPYHFFKEILDPYYKYFEIGNSSALEEANNVNPRVRFYNDNQEQDGPNTCKGLEVIYSDGVFLRVYPKLTSIEKLDLDIEKLVDHVDEQGMKWSKPNARGVSLCVSHEFNPQINFLSKVYRDAPFSLKTDPQLKKELYTFL